MTSLEIYPYKMVAAAELHIIEELTIALGQGLRSPSVL